MFKLVQHVRNKNTLVQRIPGGQQLSRKRAASDMSLATTSPVKNVNDGRGGNRSFGLTTSTPDEQGPSESVAVLRFPLEGGIGNDTEVAGVRPHALIGKLLGVFLDPLQKVC